MLPARLRGVARPRSLAVVAVVLVTTAAPAVASWTVPGSGSGVAQASPDFHAPSVNSATIAPVGMTAAAGGVRAGGQFVVYAKITDPGGTGVASARADVSALAAGSTSVVLNPCVASCTIGGTTYTWSSAPITADAGLTQGTTSFTGVGHRQRLEHGHADLVLGHRRQHEPDGVGRGHRRLRDVRCRLRSPGRHLRRLRQRVRRGLAGERRCDGHGRRQRAERGRDGALASQVHVELHDRRRHLRVQERGDHRRVAGGRGRAVVPRDGDRQGGRQPARSPSPAPSTTPPRP